MWVRPMMAAALSGRTAKFGGEDAGNQRCRRCQTEQENLFFQFAETEGRCKQKTDERENEGLMRQKKKRRPWPVVVSLFLFPVSQMHADGEQSERKKKARQNSQSLQHKSRERQAQLVPEQSRHRRRHGRVAAYSGYRRPEGAVLLFSEILIDQSGQKVLANDEHCEHGTCGKQTSLAEQAQNDGSPSP